IPDGVEVDTGRNRLVFARPSPSAGDVATPAITALELRIANRAATRAYLESAGIALAASRDGRLAVPAAEANGVALLLSEA
ncbi:MAG TPA: hypothetical protein VMB84_18190, partial [Stellaceae bacterium]|nr:hypothetical protein [Stellaceae bacterium]